jgi:hypothetical protein
MANSAKEFDQTRGLMRYAAVPSFGRLWFVNSTGGANSTSNGRTPDAPFATLAYAFSSALVAAGDTVYVAPGHTETIAAAGGITCSVAGVTIIGEGNGSLRPTFTWSATASTWLISAANIRIQNIRCTVSIDEVVSLFSVTAAGVTLDAVDFFETASAQAIQFLLTTAAADQLTIRNCYHRQDTAAGAAQLWIQLVGCNDTRILDNTFILAMNNAATTAVINATTAVVNCQIGRNVIQQTGGTTQVSAILLVASSTGFVHDNRVAAAVTTLAGVVALASAYGAENYAVNTVNKSGILDPVADT